MPQEKITIIDDADEGTFLVEGSVPRAGLAYDIDDNHLELIHTYVPPEHEGKGLGGALVTFAVEHAIEHDLTIIPSCPFAADWLRRHPDVAGRVTIEWPEA